MLTLLLSACFYLDDADVTKRSAETATDADGDGWPTPEDCDDDDPTVNPDAIEICDGLDNDCDHDTDDADASLDTTTTSEFYEDHDEDGVGDDDLPVQACFAPEGTSAVGGDCDDTDASVGGPVDWYVDADHDGYGSGDPTTACEGLEGQIAVGGDCDDLDPASYPGAPETCGNGVDEDCDGDDDEHDRTPVDIARVVIVGDTASDRVGTALAWSEDLTQDGQPDLLIGAPGVQDVGAVYLVTTPISAETLDLANEAVVVLGEAEGMELGASLAATADQDGNGHADFLAGAPGWDAAYYFSRSVSVDSSTRFADAMFYGPDGSGTGSVVAFAGRFYEGAAARVLGASAEGDAGSAYGVVYVSLPLTGGARDLSSKAETILKGSASARLGTAAISLGDTDFDGLDDLALGAAGAGDGAGVVYVVPGGTEGAHEVAEVAHAFEGESADDQAGTAVAAPGDVTGDGHADLLVAASRASGDGLRSGVVYLVAGPFEGGGKLVDAAARIEGEAAQDGLGTSLGGLGDIDDDGTADLVIGATSASDGGVAYVFLGPLSGTVAASCATRRLVAESTGDKVGAAVLGDVDSNGDGTSDLFIGATVADGQDPSAGAVYLIDTASLGR